MQADMILGKIGHDRCEKRDSEDAVELDSLGGNLDDGIFDAAVDHFGKDPIKLIALGGRIAGGRERIVDADADRSDGSGADPVFGQDVARHFADRGFTLCSGDADDTQLPFGVTEQRGGKRSQRTPRVFRYQLYGVLRKRELFFTDENP